LNRRQTRRRSTGILAAVTVECGVYNGSSMLVRSVCFLVLSFSAAATAAPAALPPAPNKPISFSTDIRPLLEQSCLQCHGKGKAKGGFSVETRESFLKGGDSGPAVVVGKATESLVVKLVA